MPETTLSDAFPAEVRSRFGLLPNFFCTALSAPGLIDEMWAFAESAYLDNPLPSLFKERLFVHLSRFCEVRYCIVRHVGFLVGRGYPSGDASAQPMAIDGVMALLRRPVPDAKQLDRSLSLLEGLTETIALPKSDATLEGPLFDALTVLFISPRIAERARLAIAHAVGEPIFELLTALLAFVRTAHYWTETHPNLHYEADVVTLMRDHPELARLMLDTSEADLAHSGERLRRALDELRTASGALRSSEDRFGALVMAISDMVFRMSADWAQMHSLAGRGFLADTTRSDSNWMSRYIPADEQARVTAAIGRAMATKAVFELEHRVNRQDGLLGWVLSRAMPILDDRGEVTEWLGAAIDLTARKNAEDALRNADRRKDEFLATLAHELRNPLAPLRNGLQIARLQGLENPVIQRTIDMMDRQVSHLAHIVDDLLDVSRITSGKIQLRRQQLKLRAVLAASAEMTRPLIDAHGHSIVVDPGPEELDVDGDFDRLVQVFSNLLSNAAKYTDGAGTITLQARRERDEAVVSVADMGIGLSPEDLPRIFDIFSQVASERDHADGGLGLGLSLVRQLVEMHRGSVDAKSPGPGQGSTFTVRLPLLMESSAAPHSELPSIATEPSVVVRRRILVADDNEDAAGSMAVLLEGSGHEVIIAADGEDTLAKARDFRPDVVFLDLGMPRMDGIEAAWRLRALPGGERMTLIALTGRGQKRDLERTKAAGFDHHLLKPIAHSVLSQVLSAHTATFDGKQLPA